MNDVVFKKLEPSDCQQWKKIRLEGLQNSSDNFLSSYSEEKDRDGIEKGFSKLATDRTLKIYTMKWLNNLVIVSH